MQTKVGFIGLGQIGKPMAINAAKKGFDLMENWNYATEASAGTIARRYPYNNQLRLGEVIPAAGLRMAWWAASPNEHTQRSLYKRWGEFMDSENWDQMMPPAPLVK